MENQETIKESVGKKITFNLAKEWAIKSHCSNLCERLEIYPDGEIVESVEISDNTWHVLKNTNESVRSLYSFYYSCGCNCDFCADYDRYKGRIEYPEDYTEEEVLEAKENFLLMKKQKVMIQKKNGFLTLLQIRTMYLIHWTE